MNSNDWFATWFDTPYYHILYKKRDDNEANRFIKNLTNWLKLEPQTRVLDLACGKGRHSITLNELGMDVLGADLAQNSISEASAFCNEKLNFIVHDMRLPLDAKFQVVFNLFTSFGYFDEIDDNKKVIQSINKMLLDNGLLVIDFMNAKKVVANLVLSETKKEDGIEFKIERKYDGKHIFKSISFSDNGEDYQFLERVQALTKDDFKDLLTENGFEILSTFGDFELNSFDEEKSDRLILIARKIA